MNPLKWYQNYQLRRAERLYANIFFRDLPYQKRFRERFGSDINPKLHRGMATPRQYDSKNE